MKKLCVHEGRRYLMQEDGEPFFYMGDTAWELFHRLTREEAEQYLSVRASQGFNVIQAVALAEYGGLEEPNAYDRLPLLQNSGVFNPETPDIGSGYDYWQHVDFILDAAAALGLYIGLLPTWGDKFNLKWGRGPEIFTPKNAYTYGKWIAERYRDRWNILWILGGDRPLETPSHREIVSAMAKGIQESDSSHLITFHPVGRTSSVDFVAGMAELDFHTVQSGHGMESYDSWKLVRRTGLAESKPFMDSEPRYEDHPACFKPEYGYFWDAADVRQNAYWNLCEGVCGHTYGNHSVWKFNTQPQVYWPYRWQEALLHDGACQVTNIVKLRMSRPFFEFRPAPELVEDRDGGMARQCAGRGEEYAFFYSPLGLPIRALISQIGGDFAAVRATWFDPRTAETKTFAIVSPVDTMFVPPSGGKGSDWVLILDFIRGVTT